MKKIIIFIGMPGCGKGTHSKKIAAKFGFEHLSTGDLLRKEVDLKTLLGTEVAEIIKNGKFVSDEIISEIIFKNLSADKNYILDGFPRNLKQANILSDYLKEKASKKIYSVVHLELPESVVMDRLLGRGRADDTEEIIKRRLSIYKEETESLLAFYEEKSLIIRVSSDDSIENVQKLILKKIKI